MVMPQERWRALRWTWETAGNFSARSTVGLFSSLFIDAVAGGGMVASRSPSSASASTGSGHYAVKCMSFQSLSHWSQYIYGLNKDKNNWIICIVCFSEARSLHPKTKTFFFVFVFFIVPRRYREDFRPLVPGCPCYCCCNHQRAYVHHLLVTNELLAGVLLMLHNTAHYLDFFHALRQALAQDRLPDLKKQVLQSHRGL